MMLHDSRATAREAKEGTARISLREIPVNLQSEDALSVESKTERERERERERELKEKGR